MHVQLEAVMPQHLARVTDRGINWSTPELLRARGEVLLNADDADMQPEAEKLFLRSIHISRRQVPSPGNCAVQLASHRCGIVLVVPLRRGISSPKFMDASPKVSRLWI